MFSKGIKYVVESDLTKKSTQEEDFYVVKYLFKIPTVTKFHRLSSCDYC